MKDLLSVLNFRELVQVKLENNKENINKDYLNLNCILKLFQ